jgi:hypothetical protein
MITPEQKDLFLLSLVSNPNEGMITVDSTSFSDDVDEYLFSSILEQFEERGFIEIVSAVEESSKTWLTVGVKAHDFLNRGGFRFEEDLFRSNFTKLELELSKFEGEIPEERFKAIMLLISTAATAVSAYSDFRK